MRVTAKREATKRATRATVGGTARGGKAPQSDSPSLPSRDAQQGLQPRLLSREDGPLYRQLGALLRDSIAGKRLAPGDELPREAELARSFGVSLITVRQALRDLEADGLIRKRLAKPAIVAAGAPAGGRVAFRSFAEIAASTRDRRLEILSWRKERSATAEAAFGLPSGVRCHCLRAILHNTDQPVGETTIYFPPAIGKLLKRSDFDDVVVFRSVQRHLGLKLSGVRITVRAEVADADLAVMLRVRLGTPVLAVEMLYSSAEGDPIELTINRNRADLFSLSYEAPNDLT